MWKRRIILGAVIVASCVFASFYGGAARYLFYISLGIPFLSLIYTFYVYLRFRIYQIADLKVIVKGEKTPYYFVLSDEDVISYADVKVTFLDDFSAVQNMKFSHSYCLVPKEKIENHTEILCKYRGEYNIGVKSVIVTDFLKLFSITYPAPSTISMSVLPKIAEIDRLALAPVDSDAKLVKFSRSANSDVPDCEMRRFVTGDSVKLINWKVSAKKNELFVRQFSDTQSKSIVFIMDMSENDADDYSKCIIEDKIIESALAAANFLVKKHTPITVVYEQGELQSEYIGSMESFKAFYEKCGTIKFHGKYSPAEICGAVNAVNSGSLVIFAVHSLSEELCAACGSIVAAGGEAAVLLISDKTEQLSEALDSRVIFRHISLSEEIADVLGGVYGQ